MNLVFAADSIWNWEAERNFAVLKAENPGLVRAAKGGSMSVDVDPETGLPATGGEKEEGGRRMSLIAGQKEG